MSDTTPAVIVGKVADLQVEESVTYPADNVTMRVGDVSTELNLSDIRKLKKILGQAEEVLTVRQEQIAKAKNFNLPF